MAPKRKAGGSSSYATVDLSDLFSRLNLATSSEEFDRVVDISNEILKSSPKDVRAAKEKITALIKLDKYKDAYDFIQASTFLDNAATVLERGFCLYKLGKGAEAQKVLEGSLGRAAQHIKAQNAYRMEDFATAMELYAELQRSKGHVDHEEEDMAANYFASKAQNTWSTGLGDGKMQDSRGSYEVQFNIAYELIALGKLAEAEEALYLAEKLCSRSGLTGEELRAEQGIILTQLAYVKQLLETDKDAASKLYQDVQNQLSVDAGTRAIALNNILSLQPNPNPFENHRLHDAAHQTFTTSKPFIAQSRIFALNSLLLSSQVHKHAAVASGTKRYRATYPVDFSASLIRIYDELAGEPAETVLTKLTTIFHCDETDVSAAMMLIQMQVQGGNMQMAAGTLEKLLHALRDMSEIKFAPGLVSLTVSLFGKVGKEEKATALLLDAKSYWSGKSTDANTATLARYAILARLDQLLSLQPSPSQSQYLETLITEQKGYLKDHPSDISTQAVLAALYSFTSPAEAAQYSSSLPSISSFTHTIDAKHLESQGIPTTATAITQKRKLPGKTRVKTRVRGGKTFDSSNKVDPERWLPLRDRSYYKPAKSKRRKVGGATQGGIVEGESMSRTGSDHEVKKADVVGKKKKKGKR